MDAADGTLQEVEDTVGTRIPEEMNNLKDQLEDNDELAQTVLLDALDAQTEADGITEVRKRSQGTDNGSWVKQIKRNIHYTGY